MISRVEKIEELISKYNDDPPNVRNELFYDFVVDSGNPHVLIELMLGPIEAEGIEGVVARKIGSKYGLKVQRYDFSLGKWSEPREYGAVFSIVAPEEESEIEAALKKLQKAKKEYSSELERLVGSDQSSG